jgi:hypothetical protein
LQFAVCTCSYTSYSQTTAKDLEMGVAAAAAVAAAASDVRLKEEEEWSAAAAATACCQVHIFIF